LCDQVGITSPFVVGHSLGGMIVIEKGVLATPAVDEVQLGLAGSFLLVGEAERADAGR